MASAYTIRRVIVIHLAVRAAADRASQSADPTGYHGVLAALGLDRLVSA